MKTRLLTILGSLVLLIAFTSSDRPIKFQGKAYYFSKSNLELGRWGARMSEAQKKQIEARLKNRLQKTYILSFNQEESLFKEEEKLDAMSGATDSWGKNFAAGRQYKNVKTKEQIQNQDFYGKKFLVKDDLLQIKWTLSGESKKIGNYDCKKATAQVAKADLEWYSFSWDSLRQEQSQDSSKVETPEMIEVTAWYSPQIPVRHGPSEFWGLPGLILEVSSGNTTMLCSKIVLNPDEEIEIKAPNKGKEITKMAYQETVKAKMQEFRNSRMGRRRN